MEIFRLKSRSSKCRMQKKEENFFTAILSTKIFSRWNNNLKVFYLLKLWRDRGSFANILRFGEGWLESNDLTELFLEAFFVVGWQNLFTYQNQMNFQKTVNSSHWNRLETTKFSNTFSMPARSHRKIRKNSFFLH